MRTICLDASIVLAWLLPEDLSAKAFALKDLCDEQDTDMIAPPLLTMEVPSGLRQAVYRGRLTPDEGDDALQTFLEMPIRIRQPDRLLAQAWTLSKTINAPRLYDMYYLALAEIESCEIWTADRRLANLAASHFDLVRWVGDIPQKMRNE